MEIITAINLIRAGVSPATSPQLWYDLGSGSGLFTMALASLLPAASQVVAVDKKSNALHSTHRAPNEVSIVSRQADFTKMPVPLSSADGFLMANSLHFVRDKAGLIEKLLAALSPGGSLIVVEYDTLAANPWVPYPINFDAFSDLLRTLGKPEPLRLGATPSLYHSGGIYSALVSA